MRLKIIVPTHIWEFTLIIQNWNEGMRGMLGLQHSTHITTIFEQGEPPSGRNVRQKWTDLLSGEECYVHFLDNDNLISTEIIEWLRWGTGCRPPSIYMFDQIWYANGPQRLIAKPENCVPCKCDISQLIVHALFLKDMVWTDRYENDGDFIAELYRRYPEHFVFVNGVNAWYNALCPGKGKYNGEIKLIA